MENKKKIILLLVFIISTAVYAKESGQALSSEEINFKIKTLEEINGKILDSIYWTIGLVGAIFSAIIALNFYQNFSINIKKLESIEKDLKKSNEELKNELKNENSTIIKNRINSINVTIEKIAESKFHNLQTKFNKLESDYKDLKRENLLAKAEKFKEKGQRGYLISYIEILKIDIEKNYDWRIFQTLDKLNEIVKEGYRDSEDISKLIVEIDKLPEKFVNNIEAITKNIKKD